MSGHDILSTLKSYVTLYEQLSAAEPMWNTLEDQVGKARSSLQRGSEDWRIWVRTCQPFGSQIRMMTQVLSPSLEGWPAQLREFWNVCGTQTANAVEKVQQVDTWVDGPEATAVDHTDTLVSSLRSARDSSVKLRHELIEEIKQLVDMLEDLIPG